MEVVVVACVALVLLVVVAYLAYSAGFDAAVQHLVAAQDVHNITNSLAQVANTHASTLEKNEAAMTAVNSALSRNTEVLDATRRDVEGALLELFQGMERAGLVRTKTARPRQVGEKAGESDS